MPVQEIGRWWYIACPLLSCMCLLLWLQEVCLHAVVASKHDTAVLLAAIRKLPPSHVLALLTYLRKWVERQAGGYSVCIESAPLDHLTLVDPHAQLALCVHEVKLNTWRSA